MIDAVSIESRRRPFPLLWFLIGLVLGIIPGLIVLLWWLLYRPHAIVFGSSDESAITLTGLDPRGAEADELFGAVENARQALQSQGSASSETSETALPSPPRVTLNP